MLNGFSRRGRRAENARLPFSFGRVVGQLIVFRGMPHLQAPGSPETVLQKQEPPQLQK